MRPSVSRSSYPQHPLPPGRRRTRPRLPCVQTGSRCLRTRPGFFVTGRAEPWVGQRVSEGGRPDAHWRLIGHPVPAPTAKIHPVGLCPASFCTQALSLSLWERTGGSGPQDDSTGTPTASPEPAARARPQWLCGSVQIRAARQLGEPVPASAAGRYVPCRRTRGPWQLSSMAGRPGRRGRGGR